MDRWTHEGTSFQQSACRNTQKKGQCGDGLVRPFWNLESSGRQSCVCDLRAGYLERQKDKRLICQIPGNEKAPKYFQSLDTKPNMYQAKKLQHIWFLSHCFCAVPEEGDAPCPAPWGRFWPQGGEICTALSSAPDALAPPVPADVVTLDPNTAHPRLVLSEDGRSVRWESKWQDLPDTPQRFTYWFYVLGQEGFSEGRHCWEVEVKGEFQSLTSPPTPLSLSLVPSRVWVCLDCLQGLVTFIDGHRGAEIFTFPPALFNAETI
ncbi:uncharacterized protein LJ264_004772 [Porphyrio hochstetteri]